MKLGEEELIQTAERLVTKLLRSGVAKGHGAMSWINEPTLNHSLKSSRHSLTAQLMATGWTPDPDKDGETQLDHLERAAIRALMAVAVIEKNKK